MRRPRFRGVLCAVAVLLCAGPAEARKRPSAAGRGALAGLPVAGDWRQLATPADRDRLRDWRRTFITTLARVRASPDAASLAADPVLFDPDRALANALPPPGAYRCRVLKLGANGTAMRNLTAYPAAPCHVGGEGAAASFYLSGGAQRPVGMLYPESPARAVFLGTMVLGDETRPLRYGQDGARDLAGYVERIDEARWRLVLPRPRFESLLDMVEIVPVVRR